MTAADISPELASRMGADPASLTFIRRSQNEVYSFTGKEGAARILRLTEDSHRSRAEIEDELEWLCHLHEAGLSVCRPVRQEDGSLVCSIVDSQAPIHAVVFEKAAGRPLAKENLSSKLYYLHGKHLGALHAFSKSASREFLKRRKPWNEERYFTSDIEEFLPEEIRDPVRDVWKELHAALATMPVTPETHGPAHLDLGYSNFFLNGDRLEMFDFDNCCGSYYASDIALALYGSLFNLLRCDFPGDRSAFAHPKSSRNLEAVWKPFREGYRTESDWPKEWNGHIAFWFEMAYFRSVIHAFRMQHPITDLRIKGLLDADIENILTRQPPVRFDFHEARAIS